MRDTHRREAEPQRVARPIVVEGDDRQVPRHTEAPLVGDPAGEQGVALPDRREAGDPLPVFYVQERLQDRPELRASSAAVDVEDLRRYARLTAGGHEALAAVVDAVVQRRLEAQEPDPPVPGAEEVLGGKAAGGDVVGPHTVLVQPRVRPDGRHVMSEDHLHQPRGDLLGVVDDRPVAGQLPQHLGHVRRVGEVFVGDLRTDEVQVPLAKRLLQAAPERDGEVAARAVGAAEQRQAVEPPAPHGAGGLVLPVAEFGRRLEHPVAGVGPDPR